MLSSRNQRHHESWAGHIYDFNNNIDKSLIPYVLIENNLIRNKSLRWAEHMERMVDNTLELI